MESKIDEVTAKEELNKWLDYKRIPMTRRTGEAETIVDELVNAIKEGNVVINEDNTLDFFLNFPVGSDSRKVESLSFKARISAGELQSHTTHLKQNDVQGQTIAKIAVLTGEVGGTIRALDSIDHSIASCISAFY